LINQVFFSIFLSKNTELKKIYKYKFLEKQAHPNKDVLGSVPSPKLLGVVVCQAPSMPNMIGLDSVPSLGMPGLTLARARLE